MTTRFRLIPFLAAALAAFLLAAAPLRAAEGPDDELAATLVRLLPELKQSFADVTGQDSLLVEDSERRKILSDMIRNADEVTIMLYTQRPDFAFDMAFALEKVSEVYERFNEQADFSDRTLAGYRSGLQRYLLLEETLRDMMKEHRLDSLQVSDSLLLQQDMVAVEPLVPVDEKEKALLDSCLTYLDSLTTIYAKSVLLALQDSVNVAQTEEKLVQAYEYAQANYAMTQKNLFVGGNVNVVELLKNWSFYMDNARADLNMRFGQRVSTEQRSRYWRMATRLLSQFFWLMIAVIVSLLIRVPRQRFGKSLLLYLPTLILAFLVILLRAIFLPASLVPFGLPPLLLIFIFWQVRFNVRLRTGVERADLMYTLVSVGVMGLAALLSLVGFSMIGVLLLTFWTFQVALLHTITTLSYLIRRYNENRVTKRLARYHQENPFIPLDDKEAFISVTWFYDLLHMVVAPLVTLLSVLLSVQLTTRAYQLSLTGNDFLRQPFFKREGMESLTLLNLLVVIALFFVFRYVIYAVKGAVRVIKMRNVAAKKRKKSGDMLPVRDSDINMSLSNSLITLLGWLCFLLLSFSILRMPTTALTTITTGLAAGIGFALKDLINNFFYGVQLMAGRIRVGDKISCDGVRGVVRNVSYQTTQVEDEDGSLIAFTNTDLFAGKFRNLNSGRNYELLKIPVGVRYGSDVAQVRDVILKALEPLKTEDKFGRPVVDPKFPIDVRFDGFGDSSLDFIVALYTTVETHYTFPSKAKEAIYNAFAENGIEIPFPQRDVYIKTMPPEGQK